MLGRALAAEAEMQERETDRPVEVTFVSSGRIAYTKPELAAGASGLADIVVELQDELVRLGRMCIGASEVAGALGRHGSALDRSATVGVAATTMIATAEKERPRYWGLSSI